jgi:hypothetical protein
MRGKFYRAANFSCSPVRVFIYGPIPRIRLTRSRRSAQGPGEGHYGLSGALGPLATGDQVGASGPDACRVRSAPDALQSPAIGAALALVAADHSIATASTAAADDLIYEGRWLVRVS